MKTIFNVYEYGEVRMADIEDPEVYLDLCVDLPDNWHESKEMLLHAKNLDSTFSRIIENIYDWRDVDSNDKAGQSDTKSTSAEAWIQSMSDDFFFGEFKTQVDDNLHEGIEDYDDLPLESTSLGMAVLYFSELDEEVLDKLGIVEIDGDRPGSSYHGMELRNTIEKANKIAQELDLDIEFVEARW
jgi:hypothetical protein